MFSLQGRLAFQSPTNEIIVEFTESCFGSNLREANSLCRSLTLVGRRTLIMHYHQERDVVVLTFIRCFVRPICCTDESRT